MTLFVVRKYKVNSRRVRGKTCVLLGCNPACSGDSERMFQDNLRSPLQGSRGLLDSCGWDGCVVLEDWNYRLSGTSVRSNHSTLRSVPEERRPHLYRGGGLISHRVRGI